MFNRKGWPRPVTKGLDGKNWPIPWMTGEWPKHDLWAATDKIRSTMSWDLKPCYMCGNGIKPSELLCMEPHGAPVTKPAMGPAATYVHPKCAVLVLTYCPHFADMPPETEVAYDYGRNRHLTAQEVHERAKGTKPENDNQPDIPEEALTPERVREEGEKIKRIKEFFALLNDLFRMNG